MEEGQTFKKWSWNNWASAGKIKEMNLDTSLTTWTKINLKWITNLNKNVKLENLR